MAVKKYKRKIYSGAVLEVEVYAVNEGVRNDEDIVRRISRPMTEEEKKAANIRKSRNRFIGNVNATYVSGGLYVTLTYDKKHLPKTYEDAESELKKYIRRIRYQFPEAKIIGVTGRGRKSGRLHHHIIVSGVWENVLIEKWKGGTVTRIEPLRKHNVYNGVDHGKDYTGLATYLYRHVEELENGKRWIQTRNVCRPEKEDAKEIKRNYSADKPPRTPKGYKYVGLTEGPGGFIKYKYVLDLKR